MKGLTWVLFTIGAMTLQFAIFPRYLPSPWSPDLLLTIVVVLGMFRGAELACIAGLLLGIVSDAGLGIMLGARALIWTQFGFAAAIVGDKLFIESRLIQATIVGGCSFISGIFSLLLNRAFATPEPFLKLLGSAVLQAAVTAVVSVFIIKLMTRLAIVPEQRNE